MSEIDHLDHPHVLVVNAKIGYYVVNKNDSVIFYSFCDTAQGIYYFFILIAG